jgi:hypothetical protein
MLRQRWKSSIRQAERKVRRSGNETEKRSGRGCMLRRSGEQRTKSHLSGRSKVLKEKIIAKAKKV